MADSTSTTEEFPPKFYDWNEHDRLAIQRKSRPKRPYVARKRDIKGTSEYEAYKPKRKELNRLRYLKTKANGIQKVYAETRRLKHPHVALEDKLKKTLKRQEKALAYTNEQIVRLVEKKRLMEEEDIINICVDAFSHKDDSPEALLYSEQCEKRKFEIWAERSTIVENK